MRARHRRLVCVGLRFNCLDNSNKSLHIGYVCYNTFEIPGWFCCKVDKRFELRMCVLKRYIRVFIHSVLGYDRVVRNPCKAFKTN